MIILTGPQCCAARALVEWPISKVARLAGIDEDVIRDFENKVADPGDEVRRKLLEVLQSAGAVFIPENGGGVGVRLKYARRDVRALNKFESEGGPAGDDDI